MDWSTLLPYIISIIALFIAIFKAPHERREIVSRAESQEADTAEKYQRIADRAAETTLKLNERVTELENEVRKLLAKLKKAEQENEDLRDWAERLVNQVKCLDAEPVTIRKERSET